jgi:hypothetical protein
LSKRKEVKYEPVRGRNLHLEKFTGRVWRLGRLVSTIYDGNTYTKSLEKFEHNPELAYSCLDMWRRQDFGGSPSSPASFYSKVHTKPCSVAFGQNAMFAPYFRGGWVKAFNYGLIEKKISQYDLRSAYLWAGMQGFPARFRPYQIGDKQFLVVFRQNKVRNELPPMFRERVCVIDNVDLDYYEMEGEVLRGISWKRSDICGIHEDFSDIAGMNLPHIAYKRITQSYWGMWASKRYLFVDT